MATTARPKASSPKDSALRPHFLMCGAGAFDVRYVINPWMEGHVGRVDPAQAAREWNTLRSALARHVDVTVVEPPAGLPDIVFAANAALAIGRRAVPSRFSRPERQKEEESHRRWLRDLGLEVHELPEGVYFEGAGDALLDRSAPRLWVGYGQRTALEAAEFLQQTFDIEVVPLRLVDERFYHLDTCLAPLGDGRVIYYPPAFDERSRRVIEDLVPADGRIAVNERDAHRFACNLIVVGRQLILNDCSDELEQLLAAWNYNITRVPLSQFLMAGGAAHCLVLPLEAELPAERPRPRGAFARRVVTLEGHVIDSGLLARIMDRITELGGSFQTLEFRIGQRREDPSFVRLAVHAPGEEEMGRILHEAIEMGARLEDLGARSARLVEVEKDGVAPEDFYGTTIYPTDVLVDGRWVRCTHQRMDGTIVVDGIGTANPTARVTLIRDLRRGQMVVVGIEGLRVHTRAREKEDEEFKFMSSSVSSERRVETAVEQIAWEMMQVRARAGRIVVVAGPVVVHTGGVPYVCELIRRGYIQVLLSGNALAVHDIERAFFGTSLGVDLKRGVVVHGGHRHHLMAINRIRRCGSIAEAVAQGVLTEGIMHECVRHGVAFSLAGSIRDDGPLPDTRMDLVEAQAEHASLLQVADMVLMLSSMLHSIGVGNMTPAGVRLVCVDINTNVATKLADRGSMEAIPVVTDVGLFLNLLVRRLNDLGG